MSSQCILHIGDGIRGELIKNKINPIIQLTVFLFVCSFNKISLYLRNNNTDYSIARCSCIVRNNIPKSKDTEETDEDYSDLQKELERKFDELFGALDSDDE